jgi:hypothetical protein
VINLEGSLTFSVFVEPADQTITAYTFRPGVVMGKQAFAATRARYSLADRQAAVPVVAGANLAATQDEQGRWYDFDAPKGATQATVWLESTVGGNVNIILTGGR